MTKKQVESILGGVHWTVIPHLKKTRRYHDYIDSIIYYLDL